MFTLLLTKLGLLHSHCVVACLCVHPTGSYFEIGWIPAEYVRVVGKAVQSIFPSNFSYCDMEFFWCVCVGHTKKDATVIFLVDPGYIQLKQD